MRARSDFVIVGAGLPGLLTALWCVRAGATVTVVDRGLRPGTPAGLSMAPITRQHGLLFHHIERWHGVRAGRRLDAELAVAHRLLADVVTELDVPCHDMPMATTTQDGHEAFWLRYEAVAMRRVGLRSDYDDEPFLPWPVRPYLTAVTRWCDPVQLRDTLLTAVRDAGVRLQAEVPAGRRVAATPVPPVAGAGLRLRLLRSVWHWADVTGVVLDRIVDDIDDGGVLLVPRSGGVTSIGRRDADPVAWLADRVPTLEVLERWSTVTSDSRDGLPFVGPLNRSDLVMCGFGAWDLTLGTAAARQMSAGLLRGAASGSTDADWPWTPWRAVRPRTVARAAWGATRLRLGLNSVTPFPKAPGTSSAP